VIATGLAIGVLDLVVDGGSGNDNLFGSQDADIFIGEDGNDFVFGDNGDDVALLGAGNDTFQWDPGDANDTIEGQDGTDRMVFNGSNANENIDISANGGRVRFFRNVASVTMDLDDVERVDFNAKGGSDTIVVNDLTGTDLKEVRVDLAFAPPAIAGDGQPDRVVVNGTGGNDTVAVATIAGQTWVTGIAAKVGIFHTETQIDEVTVNGLVGNDILSATGLAVTGPLLTLDGGDGDDTVTGSAGDDVLLGGNGNDRLIGSAGDDLIDGGAGNDSIGGGAGDDILNGGDGTDTIDGGTGDDIAANGETVTNV
jgi:Ca2+-binding RTX toxin-like protein